MLLLACAVTGCSDQTARVSGKVLLDDKPMKVEDDQRGMLVFRPVAGGPTCSGLVSPDGTYKISTGSSAGLVPGDYMVSVRLIQLIPAKEGEAVPSGEPLTPAVYADPLTSGLTVAVKSGQNNVDIELSSAAGPAVLPVAETESAGDDADPTDDEEDDPADQDAAEVDSEDEEDDPADTTDNSVAAEGDDSAKESDNE